MPRNGEEDIPHALEGWQSGSKLAKYYVGHNPDIDRKLKALRETLIDDLTAAGFPKDDATVIVEHNLIGLRRLPRGQTATYGSPEAVAMLNLKKKDVSFIPPAPKEWQSGSQLRQLYAGCNETLDRKLKALRETLIDDLTAAGFPEDDATAIVEHNLIGLKKPPRGFAAVYGSPVAIDLLQDERLIQKRAASIKTTEEPYRGRG
jgi:hypothetical protein